MSWANLRRLLYATFVVAYFFITYVVIMWVCTSIVITNHGIIKWAEGWERTVEWFL